MTAYDLALPTTHSQALHYVQKLADEAGLSFTQYRNDKNLNTVYRINTYAKNHWIMTHQNNATAQTIGNTINWAHHATNIAAHNPWATAEPEPAQAGIHDEIHSPVQEPQHTQTDENSKKLLQDLYNYRAMKLRKNDSIAYEKNTSLKNPQFNWINNQGLVGIEVEVENITNPVITTAYWEGKADNSLRNNGVEFVSVPLQPKQIQYALEHLFSALTIQNNPDFSNRTSIHVHINCRDMTLDQIWNMCLLYAVFEKHFYKVAGTKRMNSIFCVPLFRTNQLGLLSDVIYRFQPSWHKYCGLNLLPLVNNNVTNSYGTIEFRHLYGTSDQSVIMNWVNDLLCLRTFAMNISKKELEEMIKDMNTTSSYLSMYHDIFSKGQKILTEKKDFEECVSNVKRDLYGDDYQKTLKKNSVTSPYWTTALALGLRG